MKTLIGLAALSALSFSGPSWAGPQDSPRTPEERGHILKMTREMIALGTTRDHNVRMDLFLKLADERARELRASQAQGQSAHHAELGRSYEALVTKGAAGTIELGAARGRDMKPALARFSETTGRHRDEWKEFLARMAPQDRTLFARNLEVAERAKTHAEEAEERGLRQNQERRRVPEEKGKAPLKIRPEHPADAEELRREIERRRELEERLRLEEQRREAERLRALRHHRH